jgi:carboxyl-terminal processing protease
MLRRGRFQIRRRVPLALAIAVGVCLSADTLDKTWLDSFDAAWKIVHDTYYDPAFNGVDWDAVKRELRPRAEAARSTDELRDVIRAMIGRLKDSHFALVPGSAALDRNARDTSGDPGFEVRYEGSQVLVTDVPRDGRAWAAGLRPGWIVTAVDGKPLGDEIARATDGLAARFAVVQAWRVAIERLRGPIGSTAVIDVMDGAGTSRVVRIDRVAEPGEPVKLGSFPELFVQTAQRTIPGQRGTPVGYIRFNVWLTPVDAFLSRAMDLHRADTGIVLDLRGNPGGLAGMLMGIAGQFLNERVSLGEMRSRDATLKFIANPRTVSAEGRAVTPYSGRLAILVDGMTGSASECFAGGMQSIGRARIFGERTMGQALPALFDRLPNGDVLIHAYADFVTATGTRLEGRGVVPDVEVRWSRDALLAGHDGALDAAIRWAGGP